MPMHHKNVYNYYKNKNNLIILLKVMLQNKQSKHWNQLSFLITT